MASKYPETLVVPPLRTHKQTFILLHGRGSNASTFGPALLSSPVSPLRADGSKNTLASAFPHAKFVFPTASRSRATVYKRSIINQWFDSWAMDANSNSGATAQEQQRRTYLQVDGLRETSKYITELLKREIALLGGDASNVVLGGLSQGCAATLMTLLLWDGEPLGAAVGMCGWLPFRRPMERIAWGIDAEAEDEIDGEDFNPFADSSEDGDDGDAASPFLESPPVRALKFLREELETSAPAPSSLELPFQRTPLLLAHGVEDEKTPIWLGREAASCLSAMEINISWKEYRGLGHWYSECMLDDMVDFLRASIPDLESEDQNENEVLSQG